MSQSSSDKGLSLKARAGVAAPGQRQAKKAGGVKLAQQRSAEACRQAAAILEVLSGLRTPAGAASALAVSLPRYYQLEQRALQGMLAACEPQRRRGRVRSEASELARLRQDKERLQRELGRQQALVRLVQRSAGLSAPAAPTREAGKKRRQRRPVARALAVARRLQQESVAAAPATVPAAGGG
jgi:hypothetical protein